MTTTKRPGLTPAMRRMLELIRAGKLIEAGSAYQAINEGFADDGWAGPYLTPRGHAALAAEPMTASELRSLEAVERSGICIARAGEDKGWIERDYAGSPWRLTPAGRTQLHNIRAAMPGEWVP